MLCIKFWGVFWKTPAKKTHPRINRMAESDTVRQHASLRGHSLLWQETRQNQIKGWFRGHELKGKPSLSSWQVKPWNEILCEDCERNRTERNGAHQSSSFPNGLVFKRNENLNCEGSFFFTLPRKISQPIQFAEDKPGPVENESSYFFGLKILFLRR